MNLKEIFELPNKIDALSSANSFEAEKIKLKMEWYKIWGTIFSIFIPLISGVIAIVVGVVLENERANTNFQIKAMEIAMTVSEPEVAAKKAIIIYDLFPDRFPKDFKEKIYAPPK